MHTGCLASAQPIARSTMSKNAWHKRYHGAALGGYMGLSLEERGAYTTVLDLMYDTEWAAGIRDNDRWIAGHLDVSVRKWNAIREILFAKGKLDLVDGLVSNKKYREVRENALETSRKRSESGASGGDKSGEVRRKAAENRQSDEANASDLPLYVRAKSQEIELEIEDSNESIPRTPEKPPRQKRKTEPVLAERPDAVDPDIWRDFLIVRQKKGAPLTVTAMRQIETEASELGWTLDQALGKCIAKNWQGFEAAWIRKEGNGNGNRNSNGSTGNGLLDACIEDRAQRGK